eukprot:g919.t1
MGSLGSLLFLLSALLILSAPPQEDDANLPTILAPEEGSVIQLDEDRAASFSLELRRPPSGHGRYRVVVHGIGQLLDDHVAAVPGSLSTFVPLSLKGAGTYAIGAAFPPRRPHAPVGTGPTARARSDSLLLELTPPAREARVVNPPANWLSTDAVHRLARRGDWRGHPARRARVVFIGDLRGMDGMKVVQLQQLRHLPRARFQIDYLDLTCDPDERLTAHGEGGFWEELQTCDVAVTRLCTRVAMAPADFTAALRRLHGAPTFDGLRTELRDAFGPLFRFLRGADIVVLSNSAGESDNYIFDIARLAGVRARVLDLGAKLIPNAGINATAFLAPSHYARQHESVRGAAAAGGHTTYIVSPAVDFARFNASAATDTCRGSRLRPVPRAGRRAATTVYSVAYIGRLATEKSPGMFLRAALLLRERLRRRTEPVELHIVVVGDGPLMAPLRIAADRAGGDVQFMGAVPHTTIVCIMAELDVLVVPSLNTETFGLVGAEAMAMGVPVVSFGIDADTNADTHAPDADTDANTSNLTMVQKTTLNVALHAQVSSARSGRVVGSEITCAGFHRALRARGHLVHTFYPFEYTNLTAAAWDVVIIEGWFEMIHAFVHEMRRVSPAVRVYFICLDPAFPGMAELRALDADGFFTNSMRLLGALGAVAPSELLLLAADSEIMRPWPVALPQYAHNVTYVGAAGFSAKANLTWMLREAAPFGLVIYGTGWDTSPEFKPYWRGVLPKDDIPKLYSSARFVLGVTMDDQREHGMINNRVFEALSCGAVFLSEHFPELEALFGDAMVYVRRRGDVAAALRRGQGARQGRAAGGAGNAGGAAAAARRLIRGNHTYHHRVEQILRADRRARAIVRARASAQGVCARMNCPRLALVLSPPTADTFALESAAWDVALRPALRHLARAYNVTELRMDQLRSGLLQDRVRFLAQFAFVLVVVGAGDAGLLPLARSLSLHPSWQPKLALFAWGGPSTFPSSAAEARVFDVIFYRTKHHREALERMHPMLQHAFGMDLPAPAPQLRAAPGTNAQLPTLCIAAEEMQPQQVRRVVKKARRGRAIFVGSRRTLGAAVLRELLAHDVEVLFDVAPAELVQLVRGARSVLLLACPVHHIEFAVQLAVGLGVPVQISQLDLRASRLQQIDAGSDAGDFADHLRLGVSRLLCYGSRKTSVSFANLRSGDVISGIVPIVPRITRFAVRVDGAACLFIDGELEMCLMQPQLRIVLNVTAAKASFNITLMFGLMSNIYTDIFHNSSTVKVTVEPLRSHSDQQAAQQQYAELSQQQAFVVMHTPRVLRKGPANVSDDN